MISMHPYDIVTAFETSIAQYCGSQYAVAVDSCTNALLLSLFYSFAKDEDKLWVVDDKYTEIPFVKLPKRTYVGVAQAVLNAGGQIIWVDKEWKGHYQLLPYRTVDCARNFRRNVFKDILTWGTENDTGCDSPKLVCLSFHWTKGLKIGKAGMILTDDKSAAYQLRKMRYDGRTERVHPKDDKFVRGYHCYMSPEAAARGLLLMQNPKDEYIDDEPYTYGDLSLQEVFE